MTKAKGTPRTGRPPVAAIDRIFKFISYDHGCWTWMGFRDDDGYGRFDSRRAHRRMYELLVGPIFDGQQIDHLCRNRSCVNPLHLDVVTNRENTLRGATITAANADKSSCPRGHQYDVVRGARKTRGCSACEREQFHRKKAARMAARSA